MRNKWRSERGEPPNGKYRKSGITTQISHKIFQKNIDTKFNIRIKRWFAVKQAPLRGGESQTAQGERSVTLGIRYRITLTKTGIDGYGVPVRNDIFVNAMMFPDMSLPPRCRPFLPKRRQRGGCHNASSYALFPRVALRFTLACHGVMK